MYRMFCLFFGLFFPFFLCADALPFTGKVNGNKVRLRLQSTLESQVVRELNKGDLLIVTGDTGEFYAVQPPAGLRGFVFRTFVLDQVVEGDHVNIRAEPSMEAT